MKQDNTRSLWDVFADEFEEPVLPYAGTSGWSGSDTSKERAVKADESGRTAWRQSQTVKFLNQRGAYGCTWRELGEHYGWHHGTATGVLSVLHKNANIARLSMRRDKCKVYVMPDYVDGRATEKHGRQSKPCPNCGFTDETK